MINTAPIYYVIDTAGAVAVDYQFEFTLQAAQASCPVTWSYDYFVNSTSTETWGTIDVSGAMPVFRISSADSSHTGLHDISIWAVVDGTNPVVRSDTFTTPITLDF